MSCSTLFRLSGLAGIISGLSVLLNGLLPINLFTNTIDFIGPSFGLFIMTGVYLRQREATARLGSIAYIINFFGLVLIAGLVYLKSFIFPFLQESQINDLQQGPSGLVFLTTISVYLIGVILFSVATIRAKVFSRIAASLYLIGFICVGIGAVANKWLDIGGHAVAGVGIIWWGYELWSYNTSAVPETGAA
jgi:hypothetical protein